MLHKHAKFKDSHFMKKIASGEITNVSMDTYKHRLITRNTKHAQFANSIINTYNDVCGEDVSDKVSVQKIAEILDDSFAIEDIIADENNIKVAYLNGAERKQVPMDKLYSPDELNKFAYFTAQEIHADRVFAKIAEIFLEAAAEEEAKGN